MIMQFIEPPPGMCIPDYLKWTDWEAVKKKSVFKNVLRQAMDGLVHLHTLKPSISEYTEKT
jgi:hypothetical protein